MTSIKDSVFSGFNAGVIEIISSKIEYFLIDYALFRDCMATSSSPNVRFESTNAKNTSISRICVLKSMSNYEEIQQFSIVITESDCKNIWSLLSFYNSTSDYEGAYGQMKFENGDTNISNINISYTKVSIDLAIKCFSCAKVFLSYINIQNNYIGNRNILVIQSSSKITNCEIRYCNIIDNEFNPTGIHYSGIIYTTLSQLYLANCCIHRNLVEGSKGYIFYISYSSKIESHMCYLQAGSYSCDISENIVDSEPKKVILYASNVCNAIYSFSSVMLTHKKRKRYSFKNIILINLCFIYPIVFERLQL